MLFSWKEGHYDLMVLFLELVDEGLVAFISLCCEIADPDEGVSASADG